MHIRARDSFSLSLSLVIVWRICRNEDIKANEKLTDLQEKANKHAHTYGRIKNGCCVFVF